MSGGSYNYLCFRVKEEYDGKMHDAELNSMIKDLYEVLHDLEWWQSGDISEVKYRETARKFKDKWFGNREETIKEAVIWALRSTINQIEIL